MTLDEFLDKYGLITINKPDKNYTITYGVLSATDQVLEKTLDKLSIAIEKAEAKAAAERKAARKAKTRRVIKF